MTRRVTALIWGTAISVAGLAAYFIVSGLLAVFS